MQIIPQMLLRQLYNRSSLANSEQGVSFSLKNRLKDVTITELISVKINGKEINRQWITMDIGDRHIAVADISSAQTVAFPLTKVLAVHCKIEPLPTGKYPIDIAVRTQEFGKLHFAVEDSISETTDHIVRIPRNNNDDYSAEAIKTRQQFAAEFSNTKLEHISHYSFDPALLRGNIEHFTGVAQIPIGLAGPLRINGEHAQGDFIIPLATTEGTLVASYNRGMKEPEWRCYLLGSR